MRPDSRAIRCYNRTSNGWLWGCLVNLYQWRRSSGITLAAALVVGLSACGGGGGGGGSSAATPAVIDAGNAAQITQEVIDVGLGAGDFGAAVGGGGILSADGGSNVLPQAMGRRRATIQRAQQTASIGPESLNCLVGGTVGVSGSVDSEVTLTPGDRITVDFNNCDDADGAIYDGRMRIDVTNFSGDDFDQYALGATVAITDLAITEDGVTTVGNGTVDLDLDLTVPSVVDFIVAGSLLELRSGSDAWVLRDFVLTETEDSTGENLLTQVSGAGTLEGSGFAGAVDFVTVSPLTATGDDYPATGQMLITGADGANIRATVLNAQTIQLAIDLNGDSVVDETQEILWSSVSGPG